MAASALDKFKKARRKFSTRVGTGGITNAGTTLPLQSVAGLDTDTGVIVVVDAMDSAGNLTPELEEVIAGVVSGSSLINCQRGLEGTLAQNHLQNAVVTMYFTESHWDGIIDGILVGHNQDGSHKPLSADTIVDGTTNHTFTAADDTKLTGIATGATANSTDATLLNRANHTGTQTAATVSDFQTAVAANTTVAANTAARHTHANKTTLDSVTAAYTTAEQTKLAAVSGTNTGDETAASIKTKLGITTLSGANTGDQDLSALATKASLATVATTGSYTDLINRPSFSGSIATDSDVVLNNPAQSDVLTFNFTTKKWENKPSTGGGTTSDATTTAKGIVQLAGDLAGTAAAPTVPALANKAPLASPAFTGTVTGTNFNYSGTGFVGGVDLTFTLGNKADKASPTFTGTVVTPALQVTGGTLAAGKVLTSDAAGNATWQTAPGAGAGSGDMTKAVYDPAAINQQVVGTTATQTLSGKTLTLPTIGGTGANFNGATSGTTNLQASGVAGATTVVLPASNTTLVGYNTIDTLSNKTLSAPVLTGTTTPATSATYDLGASTNYFSALYVGSVNPKNASAIQMPEGGNLVAGTATGTKLGTATTQKLGFFGATPVVQQAGNALSALSALGLITTPTLTSTDVGLANVDNTSDATKNAATATLTNKTIDTAGTNTIKINGNTLSASAGTGTITLPNSSTTLVGVGLSQDLTAKTLTTRAGTATQAPIVIPSGVALTTPINGAIDNDGTSLYWTNSAAARMAIVMNSQAQTLVNKRINKRVLTVTPATNVYTPAGDTTDVALITSPAAAFTVANPSGTPTDGQQLTIRIKSGATAFGITWDTLYLSSGIATLPTTGVASKTITMGFTYDLAQVKWVLMAADTVGY